MDDAKGRGNAEKLLRIWAVVLIVFSMAWPSYGAINFFVYAATPFSMMALISWPIFLFLVFSVPNFYRVVASGISEIKFVYVLIAVWFLWRFLSSLNGELPQHSLNVFFRDFLYGVPLIVFSIFLVKTTNNIREFYNLILFAAFIILALGIVEFATEETLMQFTGVTFYNDSTILSWVSNPRYKGSEHRLQSVFFHPIVFGQFLCWVIPFLLSAASCRQSSIAKVITVSAIIVSVFLAIHTETRSAVVGVIVGIAIYFGVTFVGRLKISRTLSWVVVIYAVAFSTVFYWFGADLAKQLIQGRNEVEIESSQVRSTMFQIGIEHAMERPILGFGDGRSVEHVGGFATAEGGGKSIDSQYLSALIDGGIPGLLLFIAAWFSVPIAAANAAFRRVDTKYYAAISAGSLAVLLVFSVLSITDNMNLMYISVALLTYRGNLTPTFPPFSRRMS